MKATVYQTPEAKADAVGRVNALRDQGADLLTACKAVGVSEQQYHRWRSGRGLGRPGRSLTGKRIGRPAAVSLNDEEWDTLHWYAIKHGSTQLAVEKFLNTEVCRPETHAILAGYLDRAAQSRRDPGWPHSVRRACKVTAEEEAQFRGKKHTADILPVGYRRLVWIDETGRELALRAGDLYESDDMSLNQPFRYVHPETGREEIGRQTLLSQCVYSLRWLGASPVGRAKDAYRAEDIADHLLAVVEAAGLPLFWRFERGPWENDFINGTKLDALGGRFVGQRWGALDDLFGVIRAFGSRGKGAIEGSFNFLQALLPMHADGVADIGRVRGEFEDANRAMMRVNSLVCPERRERELAKFWSIEQAANGIAEAMADFSRRPKARREFGPDQVVPVELWRDTHPGKRSLKSEDAWYFMPQKLLATVRQGQVSLKVPHYDQQWVFTVNGVPGADVDYLPHGLRVLVAFHPGHPERGMWVFNADMGSLNRGHWHFGQRLVAAAPCWNLEAPAQIDLRPRHERGDVGGSKKRASAAARNEFRSIRDTGQAAGAPSMTTARDGAGNALVMATGGLGQTGEGVRQTGHDQIAATRSEIRAAGGEAPADDPPPPRRGTAPAVGEAEEAAAMAMLGL